jgi:predicted nuclease of restriction endonuclease-like (RecB) superfamily
MRRFAEEYSLDEIGQQVIDQLPWGHNIILMYQVPDKKERAFYIQKAREYGWSRSLLSMQIECSLYKREGKAVTNFDTKGPKLNMHVVDCLLLAKAKLTQIPVLSFDQKLNNFYEKGVKI